MAPPSRSCFDPGSSGCNNQYCARSHAWLRKCECLSHGPCLDRAHSHRPAGCFSADSDIFCIACWSSDDWMCSFNIFIVLELPCACPCKQAWAHDMSESLFHTVLRGYFNLLVPVTYFNQTVWSPLALPQPISYSLDCTGGSPILYFVLARLLIPVAYRSRSV